MSSSIRPDGFVETIRLEDHPGEENEDEFGSEYMEGFSQLDEGETIFGLAREE